MKLPVVFLLCLFLFSPVRAEVVINSLHIYDSSGRERERFSNTERMSFEIRAYNTTEAVRVDFEFYIADPDGLTVFSQTGNSVTGKTGNLGSRLNYIPGSFYTQPGKYKFSGAVKIPGTVFSSSLEKEFQVYSPLVSLTYPSDSQQDIMDNPLVFRWTGSGAVKYRVYVDNDSEFYDTIWTAETTAGYAYYPSDSEDDRQKLSPGVVYFWKVEGLDDSGLVTSKAAYPFRFTVKPGLTQAIKKDLAIKDLSSVFNEADSRLKIDLTVINNGSRDETNIPLNIYVDGVPAEVKKILPLLAVNEEKIISYSVSGISRETLILTGTVDLFDDNMLNNTLSKTVFLPVKRNTGISGRIREKGMLSYGLKAVSVSYQGGVSGKVLTDTEGNFWINDLKPGEYLVGPEPVEGYLIPMSQKIILEMDETITGLDFVLEKVVEPVAVLKPEESLSENIRIIGELIPDTQPEVKAILSTAEILGMELEGGGDASEILKKIKEGKAQIIEIRIE